jgi:hypothetical protein
MDISKCWSGGNWKKNLTFYNSPFGWKNVPRQVGIGGTGILGPAVENGLIEHD